METAATSRGVTSDEWIAVDFDGTLAIYTSGQFPALGAPIPAMVDRVRGWLADGLDVRIFTARVSVIEGARGEMDTLSTQAFVEEQRHQIEDWCEIHLGRRLPVTCVKDFKMAQLWDDRCVQMIPNTGQPVAEVAGA